MSRHGAAARLHVVVLAGGGGTRFWPASRAGRPKQFLSLAGGRPLLAATWRRLAALAPPARRWVVTPVDLAAAVRRMLPALRPDRLLLEPTPRDTAAAVTLACLRIEAEDPGAVIGIFPADHVVRDARRFQAAVRRAAAAARRCDALVCLGVVPDRPATGFGYLECAPAARGPGPLRVRRFVEKPAAAAARRYVRSGRHLWNAGMFVWRAPVFRAEMERAAPRLLELVERFAAGQRRAWGAIERRSLDYALMEKASSVLAVPLRAGWDDVGSWDAAARLAGGAALDRGTVVVDSPGSAVFARGRAVALVGVPGVVVVDTDDALLVVSRDRAEDVRQAVDALRRRGRRDLL